MASPLPKYAIPEIAAGVLLGMLEDLLVVALLVATLVAVDRASRRFLHKSQQWIGDRYRTSLVLKCIHHTVRFTVVLTLVAAVLAPSAADMVLIRSHHTRLSAYSNEIQSSEAKPSLATITIVGTAVYCTAVSLIFVVFVDFGYCLPRVHTVGCRKSSESSYLTPTYLDLGFSGYKSPPLELEAAPHEDTDSCNETDLRYVTVVSAPSCTSEAVEDAATPTMDLRSIPNAQSRDHAWLKSFSRVLLGSCIIVGVFALVAVVVCAISKDASPLVAAVALNASLNELFRRALGTQLVAVDAFPARTVEPASEVYSRLVRI